MKMPLRWKIAQTVELKWWQRYLGNKTRDEYLEWKTNYWKTFLDKIDFKTDQGTVILDAGCGPAGVFTVLAGKRIDAIDPLLDAYEEKLPHFSKNKYPGIKFFTNTIEEFSPIDQYDTIFCLNAINHVADIEKSVKKLSALLKPGGTLILSVDSHNHNPLKWVFRTLPGDVLHPHQYDLSEYIKMIEKTGLTVLRNILIKKELIFSYYVIIARNTAEQ